MTTLSPPPNWYVDPTGRHEARYWDGFTWTAHVADRGAHALDPMVRTAPVAAPAPSPDGAEVLGPGTASLRAMASERVVGPVGPAAGPTTPVARVTPRRRSLAYDLSAALAIVIVVALGGYALWTSWLRSDVGGTTDPRGAVPWRHETFRLDLPPSWVDTTVPGPMLGTADGAFRVIDPAAVVAYVGDDPAGLAEIPSAERVIEVLSADVAAVPGTAAVTPQIVDTDVRTRGDRFIGVVVADLPLPDGTLRIVEHLVVTRRGSVALLLYGQVAGVDRHRAEAWDVAESVVVARRSSAARR